ncbi:MAG: hypothetical protein R2764_17695 [Bacteroidales bacterium]
MNKQKVLQLIYESIRLELNAASLYQLFYNLFPEDSQFWWKLMIEEKGHAALLETGKDSFLPMDKFPVSLLAKSINEVKAANNELEELIEKFENNPPTREEAFTTAYNLENSAGEIHFQRFVDGESKSHMERIFQKLIREDKDHELKLKEYMLKNNIHLIE